MLTWDQLQVLCQNELHWDAPQLLGSFESGIRRWNTHSDTDQQPDAETDQDGFLTVGKRGKAAKRRYEDLVHEWLMGDPVKDWRMGRLGFPSTAGHPASAGTDPRLNMGESPCECTLVWSLYSVCMTQRRQKEVGDFLL